jgi:DNA polymerase III gamma/tau subunit
MFATFKDIWGNQALLAGLGKALETGKMAHAYLIMGAEGTQKETLAHAIASAILCDAPTAVNAKAAGISATTHTRIFTPFILTDKT